MGAQDNSNFLGFIDKLHTLFTGGGNMEEEKKKQEAQQKELEKNLQKKLAEIEKKERELEKRHNDISTREKKHKEEMLQRRENDIKNMLKTIEDKHGILDKEEKERAKKLLQKEKDAQDLIKSQFKFDYAEPEDIQDKLQDRMASLNNTDEKDCEDCDSQDQSSEEQDNSGDILSRLQHVLTNPHIQVFSASKEREDAEQDNGDDSQEYDSGNDEQDSDVEGDSQEYDQETDDAQDRDMDNDYEQVDQEDDQHKIRDVEEESSGDNDDEDPIQKLKDLLGKNGNSGEKDGKDVLLGGDDNQDVEYDNYAQDSDDEKFSNINGENVPDEDEEHDDTEKDSSENDILVQLKRLLGVPMGSGDTVTDPKSGKEMIFGDEDRDDDQEQDQDQDEYSDNDGEVKDNDYEYADDEQDNDYEYVDDNGNGQDDEQDEYESGWNDDEETDDDKHPFIQKEDDILTRIARLEKNFQLKEAPEDAGNTQNPSHPQLDPKAGPDAAVDSESDPAPGEDEEELPIEVEDKTKELTDNQGFELESNNSYEYYDRIRGILNDEESIKSLNQEYESIPKNKRKITPAKYLYDKVLANIKEKRKRSAGGDAGAGMDMMGGMPPDMGGGAGFGAPMGAELGGTGAGTGAGNEMGGGIAGGGGAA